MPPRLMDLGVTITDGATAVATRIGDAIESMGARGEAAARRFASSAANVTAQLYKQADANKAASNTFLTMEQATEAEMAAAYKSIGAHQGAAGAVSEHSLNIGRLARNLEGFAVAQTGANGQVALMAASLAHAELGGLAVVGALGAIAAGIYIWKAWTAETTKAAEELKTVQETLDKIAASQKSAFSGADAVSAGKIELEELNKLIAAKNQQIERNSGIIASGNDAQGRVGDAKASRDIEIHQLMDLQAQRDKLTAGIQAGTRAEDAQTKALDAARAAEQNKLALSALAVDQLNQRAAASDRSTLSLAILAANQTAETATLTNSLETRREVRDQLNATTEAQRMASIASAEGAEELRQQAAARAASYRAVQTDMAARQKLSEALVTETFALNALRIEHQHEHDELAAGEALTQNEVVARLKAADATRDQALAENDLARAIAGANQRMRDRTDNFLFPVAPTGHDAFSGLNDVNTAINEKNKALLSDLRRNFASFFDSVLTGGLDTFDKLFSGVLRMAEKLIADLAARKLTEGLAASIGTAATKDVAETGAGGNVISGVVAFGKAGLGAIEAHPYVAAGIAIAALGVTVLGLKSNAEAARQAADLLRQKQNDFNLSFEAYALGVQGANHDFLDGAIAIHQHKLELDAQIEALYAGKDAEAARNGLLAQNAALETQAKNALAARLELEKQYAIQDLAARALAAEGHQDEADALALLTRQQREYADAQQAGKDATYLATLAIVQQMETTAVAITKVKGVIDGLTNTIGGLQSFRDSLNLDATTSPADKLVELKRQYDAVLSAAQGGDQGAAGRLPAAAQAYLDAARAMYASTGQYVDILNQVKAQTDATIKYYADQKSVAQAQLDALLAIQKAQESALSVAISTATASGVSIDPAIRVGGIGDDGKGGKGGGDVNGDSANLSASVRLLAEGFSQTIAELGALRNDVAENNRILQNGLEGLVVSRG